MHSHIIPLFGDGAGAVIVSNKERATDFIASIEDIELYSDGSGEINCGEGSRISHSISLWIINNVSP